MTCFCPTFRSSSNIIFAGRSSLTILRLEHFAQGDLEQVISPLWSSVCEAWSGGHLCLGIVRALKRQLVLAASLLSREERRGLSPHQQVRLGQSQNGPRMSSFLAGIFLMNFPPGNWGRPWWREVELRREQTHLEPAVSNILASEKSSIPHSVSLL